MSRMRMSDSVKGKSCQGVSSVWQRKESRRPYENKTGDGRCYSAKVAEVASCSCTKSTPVHTTRRNNASSAVTRIIRIGSCFGDLAASCDEAADMPPLIELLWPASGSEYYEIAGHERMA